MNRFTVARINLFENDLEELKKKTGESTVKEAISKAITHYIHCPYANNKEIKQIKKKGRNKAGRKPSHLTQLLQPL